LRIKTDAKRQLIIDTAYRLFRANGFEKTSMSEVTAQVGGSKATLYNYFTSKEELFLECMVSITDHYLEGILSNLKDTEVDVETALFDLAKRALRLMFAPEMLASRRLLIAEAERSGIGRLFHEKIISYHQEIASFLERAMEEGKLRKADPLLAAAQFRALLEAEVFEPCILGVQKVPLAAATVSRTARNAVTTFLLAYAPSPNKTEVGKTITRQASAKHPRNG
jgi:AcrR family transcriptional regulator